MYVAAVTTGHFRGAYCTRTEHSYRCSTKARESCRSHLAWSGNGTNLLPLAFAPAAAFILSKASSFAFAADRAAESLWELSTPSKNVRAKTNGGGCMRSRLGGQKKGRELNEKEIREWFGARVELHKKSWQRS